MVNENYTPSEEEDRILDVFKEGRDEGSPWGYATPRHLREVTETKKGNIEYYLRQLTSAGWLKKVTRGFYKFVSDPREESDEH
ncbi:hypothetical protein [Halalkalicoccus jeotgali]|uniref:hypothetical protein n=1 Tax=Halalkalicoccus jeotgali TaxID=413810 RepID=UPI00067792F4|nr:hypothetical protein [Halalkalicoccus jeotgali]